MCIFNILNRINDEESLMENIRRFSNNIDKQILRLLDTVDYSRPITQNNVKCSESAVINALYYVNQGKSVIFNLGYIGAKMSSITHCWIEVDGQIIQTHVPYEDVRLITAYSVKLLPNDVEAAKTKIKTLVESV